jgi:hypothetical protein
MSMAQITAAGEAMNECAATFKSKRNEIDAAVQSGLDRIDGFIETVSDKLVSPKELRFNASTIYSKTSFAAPFDPTNSSRSQWKKIDNPLPEGYFYYINNEINFVKLSVARAYINIPGFYENPKFQNDLSITVIDFVIAEINSNNQDINSKLLQKNLVPATAGTESFSPESVRVPILSSQTDGFPAVLFARFRNKLASGHPNIPNNAAPQQINDFGGNAHFSVHSLSLYRK